MVLHQAFRARSVRKTGSGGEVRHGVTSGVSCETSLIITNNVTPHLHLTSTGSAALAKGTTPTMAPMAPPVTMPTVAPVAPQAAAPASGNQSEVHK